MTKVIERIKAKEMERGKEKRNIPKLRFREFKDEWKTKSIKDFSERIIRKNKDNISKRVLTISAQYGLINQEEFFNKSVASKNLEGYYLLENGEFAYNKSYSNGYPFGAIKKLNKYKNGVVSNLYVCFKADNKLVNSNFLEQYFETDKWHKEISMIAVEGARNHGLLNISIPDFFETKHNIPLIQEQKKIAHFFALIDRKIEKQSEKIEALKTYQKGIIQKIFKQEIRFKDENGREYPEWGNKKINEIFILTRGEVIAKTAISDKKTEIFKYPVYSSQTTNKGILGYDAKFDFSGEYLTWTTDGANAGKVFKRKGEFRCTNVCGLLVEKAETKGFANNCIKEILDKATPRHVSYVGNPKLMNNVMGNIRINIPCLSEQSKIAEFLTTIDEKMDKEEKKLEKLKVYKKGLLQKMFV